MPGLILAAEFNEGRQWPQQAQQYTEASASIEANAQALSDHLDSEGRLTLPRDFSGSFDPAGFEMVLGEDGAPRFLPQGGPADPDERWSDLFSVSGGCDDTVRAIARGADGEFYFGGEFSSCGGVAANRVVRFDPATQTWSALGSGGGNGVNNAVHALAVSGSELYVGGQFTQANVGAAVTANRIARWNGSAWVTVGSGAGNGMNGTVRALAVTGSDLYVGGDFSQANVGAGVTAERIARWNGSAWSALGSGGGNGMSGSVLALAASGSDLYVGGVFTQANVGAPISANRIARWNGSAWSALGNVGGGNGVNQFVRALLVSGSDLYVGGEFTQVNVGAAISANNVARWDGSAWSALGSGGGNGVNSFVHALAVSDGNLYVGGDFLQANVGSANAASRIARWNGSAWSALGSGGGEGLNSTVFGLAVSGSELYVGGGFDHANVGAPITANRIARLNGSAWSVVDTGGGNGVSGAIVAVAVSGGDLYVGGDFTSVGNITANHVARWDGSTWSALGSGGGNGVNGGVRALAVSGNDLYVGGFFTLANAGAPISANRIARWNGSTWSALGSGGGNGVSSTVQALAVSGSDLYVGGFFNQVNVGAPITANRIARWNGSAWSVLGSGGGVGVDNAVFALAVSGNDLYLGGSFTQVNVGAPITANRVARWNGSSWSALGSGGGNGVSDWVYALAVSGNDVYAGGSFTQANVGAAIAANYVARWNGSAWSALGSGGGNGVNNLVHALAVSGSDVYLGGDFTAANAGAAFTAERIARWNGNTWTALGSGANGRVSALALNDPDTLYALGSFTLAGGKPSSRIGRYTTRGTLSLTLAGAGSGSVESDPAGLDCSGNCSANFAWDQSITLTATANPDSEFVGWSGGGCSGTAPCVVNFDQNINVSAEFELGVFTIGGTVSGLAGSGLVLQNNGGDDLLIAADGAFSFPTALDNFSAYMVTVLSEPSTPNQTCAVSNAGGNVAGANVSNVEVSCTTNSYTVGGTVSGHLGTGLVVLNNGGDPLVILADGTFTFAAALLDLNAYDVTVLLQPSTPSQTCVVKNGSGNLAGANVTNVQVNCTTDSFTVGGTVSGLAGSGLVLQNNGGDNLPIAANGSFTFATALLDLNAYSVTVLNEPDQPKQVCEVSNGSGILAGANITGVAVSCADLSVEVMPSQLDFGDVILGDVSAAEIAVVENTGQAVVQVTGTSITGPASAEYVVIEDTCTSVPLLASQFCGIEVVFEPAELGTREAQLSITVDQFAEPFTVDLIGISDRIWYNGFETPQ